MRLDRLDVYHVSMPLIYPWRTAYGEDHAIDSVLVKATSDGVTAWSEATPFRAPHYVPESAGSVYHLVTEIFGPLVVGREFDTAADLDARLAAFKGNGFAKAAIEVLWWTLECKRTGTPLHTLLGGSDDDVIAGADFGILDSFDDLLADIQKAVDAGFPRIKLKARPGWDVEMLRAVRGSFPDTILHIDCNAGYTLDDLDTFKTIDQFRLAFLEQPLQWDDVVDHAELSRQIETPICLDESARELRTIQQALEINACQYVNIKPGRSGGLTRSLKIHDMCRDHGVPVWIGGMLESSVGAALCIELATLPNFTYPGDLFPSSKFYVQDLAEPALELTDNLTFKPLTDGLPEPVPERLTAMTIKSTAVTQSHALPDHK